MDFNSILTIQRHRLNVKISSYSGATAPPGVSPRLGLETPISCNASQQTRLLFYIFISEGRVIFLVAGRKSVICRTRFDFSTSVDCIGLSRRLLPSIPVPSVRSVVPGFEPSGASGTAYLQAFAASAIYEKKRKSICSLVIKDSTCGSHRQPNHHGLAIRTFQRAPNEYTECS